MLKFIKMKLKHQYILHEIKHGLDHFNDCIGFENNNQFISINEGATQRFATDIAEEILSIKIPKKSHINSIFFFKSFSIGISLLIILIIINLSFLKQKISTSFRN